MGNEREWDVVITPKPRWLDLDVAGLWRYRDLVLMLFRRDFFALYKQTLLGPIWYLLQPILTAIAFSIVFGRIARIPTDEVPPFLFYMAGIVLWNFFAQCLVKTSDVFVANAGIFSKVYFPRLVVPVSVILSNVLVFGVQFALLLATLAYYWTAGFVQGIGPQWLAIVPVMLYLALLGLGMGIVASALTTRYRDLSYGMGFAVQLWMYATPIVYPLSQVPERWRWVFHFNPMTAPAETFRWILFGTGQLQLSYWLASLAIGAAILLGGLVLFGRAERTSMDTV